MKKYITLACMISVITVLSCSSDVSVPREGVIEFVMGDVQIVSTGKKDRAKIGDIVKQDMSIITKERSFVSIRFGENVIRVNKKTVFTFSTLEEHSGGKPGKTEISVNQGTILSKIADKLGKNEEFTISSPTTVAAVRGTEFLFIEKKEYSIVACYNGAVEVRHADGKEAAILLKQGEMIYVVPGTKLKAEPITDGFQKMHYIGPKDNYQSGKVTGIRAPSVDKKQHDTKVVNDKRIIQGINSVLEPSDMKHKNKAGQISSTEALTKEPGEKPKMPLPAID